MTHVSNPELELAPEPGGTVVKSEPKALAAQHPQGAIVADNSPAALLHLAVEKGMAVEQLEALVGLRERMEDRQARRDYSDALAAFQADSPLIFQSHKAKIVTKGGTSFQYTFAPLDEIMRAIRPLLTEHGLSARHDAIVDKGSITVKCIVSHVGGHSESSSVTLPIDNDSAMSAQQKVGAAMTFGRRLSLSAALGLVTTDEQPDAAANFDPTKITEDQGTAIEDLLKETGANREKFLDHFKIEQVADLRAAEYQAAVTAIKQVGLRRQEKVR